MTVKTAALKARTPHWQSCSGAGSALSARRQSAHCQLCTQHEEVRAWAAQLHSQLRAGKGCVEAALSCPPPLLQGSVAAACQELQREVKSLQGYIAVAEAAFQAKEADCKNARQQLSAAQAGAAAPHYCLHGSRASTQLHRTVLTYQHDCFAMTVVLWDGAILRHTVLTHPVEAPCCIQPREAALCSVTDVNHCTSCAPNPPPLVPNPHTHTHTH